MHISHGEGGPHHIASLPLLQHNTVVSLECMECHTHIQAFTGVSCMECHTHIQAFTGVSCMECHTHIQAFTGVSCMECHTHTQAFTGVYASSVIHTHIQAHTHKHTPLCAHAKHTHMHHTCPQHHKQLQ